MHSTHLSLCCLLLLQLLLLATAIEIIDVQGEETTTRPPPTTPPPPPSPRTPNCPAPRPVFPATRGVQTAFTITADKPVVLPSFAAIQMRIQIQFVTSEPRGVLLYIGRVAEGTVPGLHLVVEIFDGVLYFIMLPPISGGVFDNRFRFRMSREGRMMNDMQPHTVRLVVEENVPKLWLDGERIPVGDERQLATYDWSFNTYTYIGFDSQDRLPFLCWSRVRFIGCINYILVGDPTRVSTWLYAEEYSVVDWRSADGRQVGCCLPRVSPCGSAASVSGAGVCFPGAPVTMATNASGVCQNRWRSAGGRAGNGSFFCDCSGSNFTRSPAAARVDFGFNGVACSRPAAPATVADGSESLVAKFKQPLSSHHDDISVHFKTASADGCIFKATDMSTGGYLQVYLQGGDVKLATNIHQFASAGLSPELNRTVILDSRSSGSYSDGRWHLLVVRRRANTLAVLVDDLAAGAEAAMGVLPADPATGFQWRVGQVQLASCTGVSSFRGQLRNWQWLTERRVLDLLEASAGVQLLRAPAS